MSSSSKALATTLSLTFLLFSNNLSCWHSLCQGLLYMHEHLRVSVTPLLMLIYVFIFCFIFPLLLSLRLISCLRSGVCRIISICTRESKATKVNTFFFSVVILYAVHVPIVACCFSCFTKNSCFHSVFFWI